MGNYQGCMYTTSIAEELPLVTIVVLDDNDGGHRIVQFRDASNMRVAELMLDYPNRYVCHSTCVLHNSKVLPLPADHELQLGHVYLLVPTTKLHRRFSQAEAEHFGSLFRKYSTQPCLTSGAKVSPGKRVSPLLRSSTTTNSTTTTTSSSKVSLGRRVSPLLCSSTTTTTTISSYSNLLAHQEYKCESKIEGVIGSNYSLPSPSPSPSPSLVLDSNESSELLLLQEEMERLCQMMSRSRSWTPKLETINESSLLKC